MNSELPTVDLRLTVTFSVTVATSILFASKSLLNYTFRIKNRFLLNVMEIFAGEGGG